MEFFKTRKMVKGLVTMAMLMSEKITSIGGTLNQILAIATHGVSQGDKLLGILTALLTKMDKPDPPLQYLLGVPKTSNGYLDFEIGDGRYRVVGGPYLKRPDGYPGVKLAEEIKADYDIKLDIVDFKTPSQDAAERAVTQAFVLMALSPSKTIYCGCMGGIGRTGLFLALMVKVYHLLPNTPPQAIADPIRYVREQYLSNAVETTAQKNFVSHFDARGIADFISTSGLFTQE